VAVAVRGKGFSAGWAGELIDRFPVNLELVRIPPFNAAVNTAEQFFPVSGVLPEHLAALLAYSYFIAGKFFIRNYLGIP
jgi:hypothetical protein